MEDITILRRRAEEHRAIAHATHDLWESVIRFNLAARYDELAARREEAAAERASERTADMVRVG